MAELFSTPVEAGRLTRTQIAQWRNEGYTFVKDLIPEADLAALIDVAAQAFPASSDPEAAQFTRFGSGFVFPADPAFNAVTLHEHLLRAIADLLGIRVSDIRLTQADLWPKYHREVATGQNDNSDQRIHVDYPNHTLVHPAPWHRPEAVELILYLDDVDETGGGTAVVPRTGDDDPAYSWPIVASPGIGDLPYINDRKTAEAHLEKVDPAAAAFRRQLYARERKVAFRPGDILLYRHDTWHRGTPMKPGTRRLVANMTFRRADAEWISTLHVGWAWKAYRPDKLFERLIAQSSLDQRAVLGFPQPGSTYWCDETIAAVEARYGMYGFDSAPYREA